MPGSIGPGELIIVLVIALIVLGPKRLPEVGRSVGKGMREFKDALSGMNPLTTTTMTTRSRSIASRFASAQVPPSSAYLAGPAGRDRRTRAREAPNECCGMIATQDGDAVAVHRARNAAASPLRYEMDGMEQFKIQSAIEDGGYELGAIYHSHTRSEPEPSQTDINLAFYPDALYVIVGVEGEEPDVRAWRIVDGAVSEAALEVQDGAHPDA